MSNSSKQPPNALAQMKPYRPNIYRRKKTTKSARTSFFYTSIQATFVSFVCNPSLFHASIKRRATLFTAELLFTTSETKFIGKVRVDPPELDASTRNGQRRLSGVSRVIERYSSDGEPNNIKQSGSNRGQAGRRRVAERRHRPPKPIQHLDASPLRLIVFPGASMERKT